VKKKIIFIVNHAAFFCSHRLAIAQQLIKQNYSFHLIIGQAGSNEMEAEAIKVLKINKISYSRTLFSPQFSINIFKEFFSIIQIIFILCKIRPYIVHLVSPKAILFGGIASKLAFIKKRVFAISGLGYFYTGKKNLKHKILKSIYFSLLKIIFSNDSTKIIIQNNSDHIELKNILNLHNDDKFEIIHGSGVDHKVFKFAKFNNRKKVILMTARILFDKGVVEFFKAAKILKKKHKDWKFILIGSIDYKSPSTLDRAIFEKLLKEKNVEWKGFKKDIRNDIKNCSIFCLPSYREGMSKSLIEAAMSGIPIVTTNVPGCRDTVIKNITGVLVKPKNHVSLALGIEKLIISDDLRILFSKKARLFAKKKFALNSVVNKTMSIYKKI
jgi:glycosyltransferase involved in cell wall biosynthesis